MKKEEYDEAIRLASQANPTWKRRPAGTRNKENDSVKDKLKGKLGAETHKMKKNGKW